MEKKSDRILTSLKEIHQDYSQVGENKNYDELLSKIFQLSNDLLQEKKNIQSASFLKSESSETESTEPEEHHTEIHDINSQIKETFKIIEQRTIKKIPSAYIPTGFELLDRRIGGWEPGELIVIGSRPFCW